METIKLTFEKEYIDVPDEQEHLYTIEAPTHMGEMTLEEGKRLESQGTVEVQRHRWTSKIVQYKDSEIGIENKVRYFIKDEDKTLFEHLQILSSKELREIELRSRKMGNDNGQMVGAQKMNKYIKSLPWWRRLFKKF